MIRIIDASSAGWGHINVDDFRFPPVIPELSKPWRPLPAQEQATVPNLVGYFKEQAYELLAETRLRLGQIRDLKADQPTGTIIEQRPGPGDKVPIGTPVHLVVAVEEIVTVPNLIGYSREQAYELLANARLKVGDITEWAADEPEGTIIDQSPSAGVRVDPGTPVELVVAITEKVTVPNLIGATMSQAEATLARSKLEVGEVAERKSDKPADTIIEQKPKAGVPVEALTPVHLVIGTKKTVAVTWPQVVIGILVVFAAGYYIAFRKKVRGETSRRIRPTITVKIHEDKGAQTIGSAVSGQTEYALRLKPKTDYGNQEIEYKDSFIIDERKDHG